ncbi:MAG: triose-phosphate isomerase [Christensenellaceae bacterium]|jgi:triosephosphate isomerase|nr:triose-phosphate isomerase [Christensenellaceae bacterium]
MKAVIANFKMNKTTKEVEGYIDEIIPQVKTKKVNIGICPSYVALGAACKKAKGSNIIVGAQNVNENDKGSFTGEVSADMLLDTGAKFTLVGHSERRSRGYETESSINKKMLKALSRGLGVVLCIGENRAERDENITQEILQAQVSSALLGVYKNELKSITIAYEPVWAIGTGVVASNGQIEDAIEFIRGVVATLYDEEAAETIGILYGGSVTENNADGIAKIKGVNGALVGGDSLIVSKFIKIISAFDK